MNSDEYRVLIELSRNAMAIFVQGELKYANPVALQVFAQFPNLLEKISSLAVPTEEVVRLSLPENGQNQEHVLECQTTELNWQGAPAALANFHDVSEYYQVQSIKSEIREQKRVDRIKDEFVSTVSHEIRTPLSIIRETTSQILDGLHGEITSAQKNFLSKTLRNIDRLTKIINDLLDISKIESGKIEIRREKVDLVSLVRDSLVQFTPQIQKKGLQVLNSFSHPHIEISIDKDKITQVFINLLSNSLKFTEQGHIGVGLKEWDNFVECSVMDTGVGVASEDLSKLFNKFIQIGRTDGPGQKGTGLGLAICKGLIELHGGKIWVQSERGQGTQMIFTLPKT
ncbi:MAG: HAMP domain-containing histidine kinase [Candidatus Omnitrophica bacterium]|nr:HAMP domain-containing histidine kinase [Candidatus Omnitrophota bacterium]